MPDASPAGSSEPPAAPALHFPAYYLELAESLVRSRQGDVAELYARCGIDPGLRLQAEQQLSLPQFLALTLACMQQLLPGEPAAIQLLRHLPVTAHGMLGLAAMTADNLDQALNVGLRYFPLSMPAFTLQRQRVGNEAHVLLRRLYDFGSPLNEVLAELIIGSFSKMLFFASASQLETGRPLAMPVEFSHAASPQDQASFQACFAAPVKFGGAENKFIVPRRVLQQPLLTRNRNAHAALIATLERQLSHSAQPRPLTQKLSARLSQALATGQLPSAATLALELGLSTRTLSRRLHAEGSSLPALSEALRMERAELLLTRGDMNITQVALALGYTQTAAFSRAFKRHCGFAPSALRDPGRHKPARS